MLILIGVLSCTGCAGTLLHVAADAKVTPEMPSAGNEGPLVPMSVPDSMPLERDAPLIVVLDVDGLLLNTDFTGLNSAGENPVSLFRERLDAIAANPCVRGVVLRINSPGGGVTATDIMWHDLMRFKRCTRLPVVACLMDVGTGGAYYLATAADQIVAHPTSVTGGIGVILNFYNLQDALQQFNIAGVPIKSGDKIDLGSPIKGARRHQAASCCKKWPTSFTIGFTKWSSNRARSGYQRQDQLRWPRVYGPRSIGPASDRLGRLSRRRDLHGPAHGPRPLGPGRALPSPERSGPIALCIDAQHSVGQRPDSGQPAGARPIEVAKFSLPLATRANDGTALWPIEATLSRLLRACERMGTGSEQSASTQRVESTARCLSPFF